jgi:hypothetical protein
MSPTNIIETVQCCYLSEEDCCNGIGPDRVVNRECCASVCFPPSPFVSTLLTLSMQQNRRAQLKGRDSWLIFSQDSVAPFSSVVRFPDGVGPGAILKILLLAITQGPVNGGGTGTRIKPDILAPGVRSLLAKWLLAAV